MPIFVIRAHDFVFEMHPKAKLTIRCSSTPGLSIDRGCAADLLRTDLLTAKQHRHELHDTKSPADRWGCTTCA
jgi:hypothetical protein